MSLTWPNKDPNDVADYDVDWLGTAAKPARLYPDDTIVTSTFTVPAGLTKDRESHTATKATVWLSGGTEGAVYEVLNRVTTTGLRQWDQTIKIHVKSH